MTRFLPVLRGSAWLAALAAVPLLAACAGERDLPTEPSFYRSLAKGDVKVDASAAASMISGYRKNNGLPPVTIDPELMKIAETQAQGMASHDKLSHDVVAVIGGIEVHRRLPISLTFDHRAATGGEAARFLKALLDDMALPQ